MYVWSLVFYELPGRNTDALFSKMYSVSMWNSIPVQIQDISIVYSIKAQFVRRSTLIKPDIKTVAHRACNQMELLFVRQNNSIIICFGYYKIELTLGTSFLSK